MTSCDGLAVLRLARLEDAYEDDRAGILDLLELVVRENEGAFSRLQAACSERHLEQVRQHAHRLRGACANIGAEIAASTAEALERLVGAGSLDEANALVARLEEQLDAVRAHVAAYRASLG